MSGPGPTAAGKRRIRQGFADHRRERDHARPDRQRRGPPRRRAAAPCGPWRMPPRSEAPGRWSTHLFGVGSRIRSQRPAAMRSIRARIAWSFSPGSVIGLGRALKDGRPVVHRVVVRRSREHDAVEQGHRQTDGDAGATTFGSCATAEEPCTTTRSPSRTYIVGTTTGVPSARSRDGRRDPRPGWRRWWPGRSVRARDGGGRRCAVLAAIRSVLASVGEGSVIRAPRVEGRRLNRPRRRRKPAPASVARMPLEVLSAYSAKSNVQRRRCPAARPPTSPRGSRT